MSSMPDTYTLTPTAAQKLGGPLLRAHAAAGGPNAVVAQAELDRRAARKAGASYRDSLAVVAAVVPSMGTVGDPVGRPARVLAALADAIRGPTEPVKLALVPSDDRPERSLPHYGSGGDDPSDPRTERTTTEPTDAEAWHVAGAPPSEANVHGKTFASENAARLARDWLVRNGTPSDAVAIKRGAWPVVTVAGPVVAPVVAPPTPDLTFSTHSEGYGAGDPDRVEVVVEETRARASADRAYLQSIGDSLGFATLPTAVQEGAVLIREGERILIRSYQDHHNQPRTLSALDEIAQLVGTEDRRDVRGGAGSIRLLPDGRLDAEGREYSIEPDAFGRLLSRYSSVLPSAGPLLRILPPDLRCDVWNTQTARIDSEPSVLRTRTVDGISRQVFAVVSPNYAAVDADEIARVTADALRRIPGGDLARGPVTYDPSDATISVDAVFHVDHTANFGAGDVFKVGCRVSSNDAGGGALRVSFLYWRNLCLNLGILDIKDAPVVKLVHRGDRAELLHRMTAGIRKVMGYAQPFVVRWTGLRAAPIAARLENPSADAAVNVRAILAELAGARVAVGELPRVKRGALPEGVTIEGIARDVAVERMLSAWRHEPGDTEADVVNAVTRLHTERVPVPVLRSAEAVSSALIGHWSHA